MNSFQLFLGIMAQILFFTFIYMIFLPDPADWSGIPPEEDRTLY